MLRKKVEASIETGLPVLREYAKTKKDLVELETKRVAAMKLLPKELDNSAVETSPLGSP